MTSGYGPIFAAGWGDDPMDRKMAGAAGLEPAPVKILRVGKVHPNTVVIANVPRGFGAIAPAHLRASPRPSEANQSPIVPKSGIVL